MKIFTLQELKDWVVKRPDDETYSYLNVSCGCLMTKMARNTMELSNCAGVDSRGFLRADLDQRDTPIGQFPFHNKLWEILIKRSGVTKAEVLAAIKRLQITEFVSRAKLPPYAL
jgi:hypothetical protein